MTLELAIISCLVAGFIAFVGGFMLRKVQNNLPYDELRRAIAALTDVVKNLQVQADVLRDNVSTVKGEIAVLQVLSENNKTAISQIEQQLRRR